MKSVLVITVAGMSTRFSESVGYPCLKCLYNEQSIEQSLLYRMIHMNMEFDYYVVVGGFRYGELETAVAEHFKGFGDRIILVQNDRYADYGSGYSLYLGLGRVRELDASEVVFAEGDLHVDRHSFQKICDCQGNVVTCSREPVLAEKSVAFYFDTDHGIHYIYDTAHGALEIKRPFLGVYNSGQIWKFADMGHLWKSVDAVGREDWKGTNLVLIQQYFGTLARSAYGLITFETWVNCNTITDFKQIGECE